MDQRPKFLEENTGKQPQDIDVGDSFWYRMSRDNKSKANQIGLYQMWRHLYSKRNVHLHEDASNRMGKIFASY